MYMTSEEIKHMWLNPNKVYTIEVELKDIICKLYLQTDFCFYFINGKKIICISKIDYYLKPRLIKEVHNEAK
jgi:hypothetical protein